MQIKTTQMLFKKFMFVEWGYPIKYLDQYDGAKIFSSQARLGNIKPGYQKQTRDWQDGSMGKSVYHSSLTTWVQFPEPTVEGERSTSQKMSSDFYMHVIMAQVCLHAYPY